MPWEKKALLRAGRSFLMCWKLLTLSIGFSLAWAQFAALQENLQLLNKYHTL